MAVIIFCQHVAVIINFAHNVSNIWSKKNIQKYRALTRSDFWLPKFSKKNFLFRFILQILQISTLNVIFVENIVKTCDKIFSSTIGNGSVGAMRNLFENFNFKHYEYNIPLKKNNERKEITVFSTQYSEKNCSVHFQWWVTENILF